MNNLFNLYSLWYVFLGNNFFLRGLRKFYIFNILSNDLFTINNLNLLCLWIYFWSLLELSVCICIGVSVLKYVWPHLLYCFYLDFFYCCACCFANLLFNYLEFWLSLHFNYVHSLFNVLFNSLDIFFLLTPWTIWRLFFIS